MNDVLQTRVGFLDCNVLVLGSTSATEPEVAYWMERIPELARFSPRAAPCHPRCAAWNDPESELSVAFRAGALDTVIAARADMFVTSFGSDEAQIIMEERVFGKRTRSSTFNELMDNHAGDEELFNDHEEL